MKPIPAALCQLPKGWLCCCAHRWAGFALLPLSRVPLSLTQPCRGPPCNPGAARSPPGSLRQVWDSEGSGDPAPAAQCPPGHPRSLGSGAEPAAPGAAEDFLLLALI